MPNEAPQPILSEEKVVPTEEKVVPQPVSGKKKVVPQPVSTKEKVVQFDTTPMTPVLTKEKVVMVKEKVVPQPAPPRRSQRNLTPIDYKNLNKNGEKRVKQMVKHYDFRQNLTQHIIENFESYFVNDEDFVDSNEKYMRVSAMSFKKGERQYGVAAKVAIRKELTQMIEYEVFIPMLLDYHEVNYMRTHDLIVEKLDGTIKARFVAGKFNGDLKSMEIDWGIDLYSPTVDSKIINLMFSIALEHSHQIEVWDIRGAFLIVALKKPGVYAKIDKFIADVLCELDPSWKPYQKVDGSLLVELKKAWYGTAAASALWHSEISKFIINGLGFEKHPMIHCHYMKILANGDICLIMLHVDDMCMMTPKDGIEKAILKDKLTKKYGNMKIQDDVSFSYVGIECKRHGDRLELSACKRIEKLCEKFNINSNASYPTKSDFLDFTKEYEDFKDITLYRSLVMSMRFIAQIVKPEILFPVSYLSTKQACPTMKDWNDALHIAKYLRKTKDDSVWITPIGVSMNPVIRVYADASWRIFKDGTSQGGSAIFIGECKGAIYCSSKKIRAACGSSTDSEILEVYRSTYTVDYYSEVMKPMGYEPVVIYMQDNTSTISNILSGEPSWDKKRKHINHAIISTNQFMDETDGVIESTFTKNLYSDYLTKPLQGEDFQTQKWISYGRR